jgi:hypothetical protein
MRSGRDRRADARTGVFAESQAVVVANAIVARVHGRTDKASDSATGALYLDPACAMSREWT